MNEEIATEYIARILTHINIEAKKEYTLTGYLNEDRKLHLGRKELKAMKYLLTHPTYINFLMENKFLGYNVIEVEEDNHIKLN